MPKVILDCLHCGREFAAYPSEVRYGRKFCSHKCADSHRKLDMSERFWRFIDVSGGESACWLWTGAKRNAGYGVFNTDGYHAITATRVA